jgi:hypothetical protein
MLVKHMQDQFSKLFVPEQSLSRYEAKIKYFGKSGLKQAIRNKPIMFGFNSCVLAAVFSYLMAFRLYQGKSIGKFHSEKVAAVSAADPYSAGSGRYIQVCCLRRRRCCPIIFSQITTSHQLSWWTSYGQQLQYLFTGTIRKDSLKGNPPLTPVEKVKKDEDTLRLWFWRIHCRSLSGGMTMPQLPWRAPTSEWSL